jgi:hypothetical protein
MSLLDAVLAFPTSNQLNDEDLSSLEKMMSYAFRFIYLTPRGVQQKYSQHTPNGRRFFYCATGDFVNIQLENGYEIGTYTLQLSIRRDENDAIYHLSVERRARALKKCDRQLLDRFGMNDIGGNMNPQIHFTEYKWNKETMTDNGFMLW